MNSKHRALSFEEQGQHAWREVSTDSVFGLTMAVGRRDIGLRVFNEVLSLFASMRHRALPLLEFGVGCLPGRTSCSAGALVLLSPSYLSPSGMRTNYT